MPNKQTIKCDCGGISIVLFYYWNRYRNTGRVVRMCEKCGKDWMEYVGKEPFTHPYGV